MMLVLTTFRLGGLMSVDQPQTWWFLVIRLLFRSVNPDSDDGPVAVDNDILVA